jgi:hypothetical protein
MSKNRKVTIDFSESSCCSPVSSVCHCCGANHFVNSHSHTAAMETSLNTRRLGEA